MKNFDVIVQRIGNCYRATVLALPQIKTEGANREEALLRAQAAIEIFFKSAEFVKVPVDIPAPEYRPYATVNDELRREALYPFPENDEEMKAWHWEAMAAARRIEREEGARQADEEEIQQRQRERRLAEILRQQRGIL